VKINDWDRTKVVTLSTGRKVTVRAVPPYVAIRAAEAFPMPDPPRITIKAKVPGAVDEVMEKEKDPAYINECMKVMAKRREAINEANWLYSLPDVEPEGDESWKEAIAEAVPNVVWRTGARGRRMDYIEWVILCNPADLRVLQEAFAELNNDTLTDTLMKATEESFRDQVQRDSSIKDPAAIGQAS
jgi:hypothetical protein